MMNAFQCPSCGAALVESSVMCSVCKTSIDWKDGQPLISSAGSAIKHVVLVTLFAVVAAMLVLAAILLVVLLGD